MTVLGAYSYYYTDPLTSINPANWTQNGVLSARSGGLTSSDPSGGSLISNLAVPDGTSDYEVKTTLALSPSILSQSNGIREFGCGFSSKPITDSPLCGFRRRKSFIPN
jgi:hypothetical protein